MMFPAQPGHWPQVFEQHFNAGDLAAVMALYAPEGLIDAKTRLRSRIIKVVTVGDIAQLYTDFEGTTVNGSGNTVVLVNKAIEVLHRHPDGSWKLIVGDPNGRAC